MFRFGPRHSRITAGLCALGLVAFAVTGCTEPVAQTAPVAAQKTTSRCRTVPKDVVAQIASFIKPETGASLRGARAVHTEDGIPGGTWYVAADLKGPGLGGDDEIIVVPMAQLAAGNGHLFGIGGFAREFTDLRSGEDSMYGFAITDAGAKAATSCVKAALNK